jgi:hypothetical protein
LVWTWESMRPGRRVAPEASINVAPSGISSLTARIFWPSMTTVLPSRIDSPSKMRALMIAVFMVFVELAKCGAV